MRTVNLWDEFEVVPSQKTALKRLIKMGCQNKNVFKMVYYSFYWAYLVQEESKPTYSSTLKIGEKLLRGLSLSDRQNIINFLLVYWKRRDFFKQFIKKYKNDILGQG